MALAASLTVAVSALPAVVSAQWLKPEPLPPTSSFKLGAPPSGQFAPRKNTLTNVKGDLWRAGDGTWFMAILNTPDGLLLVDTAQPRLHQVAEARAREAVPRQAGRGT